MRKPLFVIEALCLTFKGKGDGRCSYVNLSG